MSTDPAIETKRSNKRGFIVAIDGPAGAGKSTIAKKLAERLSLALVDTGALYRAVALAAKERGLSEEAELGKLTAELDLSLESGRVLLNGRDVSTAIRTQEISELASRYSAFPAVRQGLLELQRRLGRSHPRGAVLEGRDIGTVVFPDAEVKVFLTASDEERARRRLIDLEHAGKPERYEAVLAAIQSRDARDTSRDTAPLRPAGDALLLDSTKLSLEEVLEAISALVKSRSGDP